MLGSLFCRRYERMVENVVHGHECVCVLADTSGGRALLARGAAEGKELGLLVVGGLGDAGRWVAVEELGGHVVLEDVARRTRLVRVSLTGTREPATNCAKVNVSRRLTWLRAETHSRKGSTDPPLLAFRPRRPPCSSVSSFACCSS